MKIEKISTKSFITLFSPFSRSIVDRHSKSIKRSHSSLADALLPPPPPTTNLSLFPPRKKILDGTREGEIAFSEFFTSTSKFDLHQILCLPWVTKQIYPDQFPDYFSYFCSLISLVQILISILITK